MRAAALIVAAGRGQRLGGALPKQYLPLAGRAVIRHAIDTFLAAPGIDRLQPVIHPDDTDLYAAAVAGITDPRLAPPVEGGPTRTASVAAGLEALAADATDLVLIHDAARPFVTGATIAACLEALARSPGVLPALRIVDALWRAADGLAADPLPRDGLWRAQTPQGFRFAPLLAAFRAHAGEAADDVAVARAAGIEVALIEGSEDNFKITTAADLAQARRIAGESMDIRTGNGFDVHAFGPGERVTLCGVGIPFGQGLVGHSDADVGLHALTDAIFGALGEGDIGRWFPPTDPAWKGAASGIFLARAAERAREQGFAITHLDVTLICEAPKIGPHAAAMRAEVARIAGLAEDRVSVKATTTEGLGFAGRREGIAALATATLLRA